MKDVLGLILGGGKGTRLFPLTLIRSKPAVPVGGKYRLIDIPISNCINSDVIKIFVLTQYNSESLNRHITQTYRFGLFSEGFVDILAAEQTPESIRWFQGTADAVRQSLRHVLNYGAKYILILSGDQLYRMNYRKLLEYHQERQADVTLCVVPVEADRAAAFGILQMDNQGVITNFFEKPKEPRLVESLKVDVRAWKHSGVTKERCLMASMGIYLFSVEILVDVLKDETKLDFGRDIIPAALSKYRVYGHVFGDYWEDIGTIGAFYKANLDLTSREPQFKFYQEDAPIYTHPRFLPATRVHNSRIQQSIVSEGCEIEDSKITHSIIGIRSEIREKSEIVNTLIMGADYYESNSSGAIPLGIGPGVVIRDAIVDKNARIGKNVRISNLRNLQEHDGENYFIRDGIVIIPKNAVIKDGTEI